MLHDDHGGKQVTKGVAQQSHTLMVAQLKLELPPLPAPPLDRLPRGFASSSSPLPPWTGA